MTRTIPLLVLAGCAPLAQPRDVTGNFEVQYADNLRVYIGDDLVAEVESGDDATIEYDGDSFQVSTLCSDDGVECPSETFWGEVGVDQPWGSSYNLLNFVNLDQEHGQPGTRMGGLLSDDGSFSMLSGLGLAGNDNCAALGVGTVTGTFSEDNSQVDGGVVTYAWSAGCAVGDVVIGTTLRLETDYTAARTGDLDLSSVSPEDPIDEEGGTVDPEQPDDSYKVDRPVTG